MTIILFINSAIEGETTCADSFSILGPIPSRPVALEQSRLFI